MIDTGIGKNNVIANENVMKPVWIFRHGATEGAGYFAEYLDQHQIPWRLIALDQGQEVPLDLESAAGLAFMGGAMSVNDDLAWISRSVELIQRAVVQNLPVIGHCLGGQLLSRALGGLVVRNPQPEIGWHPVRVIPGASTAAWLGDHGEFDVFEWHNETFTIPQAATQILVNSNCTNQAFVWGPHIAMQFHIEMTPDMVHSWCQDWRHEVGQYPDLTQSIQTPQQMQENLEQRIDTMRVIARRIYDRWRRGLVVD